MKYQPFILACLTSVVLAVAVPGCAQAQTVRDTFLFGIGIHLGQKDNAAYGSAADVMAGVRALGATATRDDLPWSVLGAGAPAALPDAIGEMAAGLNEKAARPVLILKGDRSIIPGNQPAHEAERALYVSFAKHAATVFQGYDPVFELWNEWNLAARKDQSLGSAADYVTLAKAAYPALKAAMPQGIVLGGAAGDDRNWQWMLEAADLGLLDAADGIAVHPYNYCAAGGVRTGWNALLAVRMLHDRLQERFPDRDVPLYITEIGWPDRDGKCGGVPQKDIAANVAQILLEAPTYPWLKGVWFYELFDEGDDPQEREHHFGLLGRDGTLKPAGCAVKTVWDFIADTQAPSRRYPYPKTPFVSFDAGSGMKRVAVWDMSRKRAVHRVKFPAGTRFVSLCGSETPRAGAWFRLGTMPVLAEVAAGDLEKISFNESFFP